MSTTSQPTPQDAFQAYPFSLDPDFQAGLRSILSTAPPDSDTQHLTEQAKIFYWEHKTGLSLSLSSPVPPSPLPPVSSGAPPTAAQTPPPPHPSAPEMAKMVKDELVQPHPHPSIPGNTADAPYPLSFAELARLIQENRVDLIPNNDLIPSTVLEGQSSESTLPPPQKPWERSTAAAAAATAHAQTGSGQAEQEDLAQH